MKRVAFVVVGMMIGFVAAVGVLPAARGANSMMGPYRQFDLFSEAFERVRANYVRPVQDSELIDGAIEGMVSNLDPHSSYMDAKSFADMQIQTKGEFGGIGIEVTMEDGLIKVISPIDDTPAAKAGLKTGDFIAAIDGKTIEGMALNDAIDKMRGPVGTKVTLTILRNGEKKPFDVVLARAVIHVDSVKWHREGDIGYIRLSAFNEETSSGLEKAVRELKKQIGPSLKGYVLDLRNNPGGLLEQAVQVSNDFLNKGEIVSTRGRHADDTQRYDAKPRPGDITDGKPVIVLINGGTASASEIVAGALQDDQRARILGLTSFGKGSVQTIIPLGEGSGGALRLTTARYYTPSGRSIQAEGIVPDIAVAQNDDETVPKIERPSEADLPGHLTNDAAAKRKTVTVIHPAPGKKYDDFQLAYALDLLRGKMTVAAAKSEVAR
ncbi:MAG: S41 family peptidase [Alphaproteobacteria bacterium]|nr:S41 family peptidase [Alphaproteobacteria bacterium]MDE2630009.1 S41 family peptidase [Alphaproteobacteria bacterium]